MGDLLRIDKTVMSVSSFDDRDDEKTFWLLKTAQERIAAIELNRRMVYGERSTTSRLQRFLEVSELDKSSVFGSSPTEVGVRGLRRVKHRRMNPAVSESVFY